MTVQYAEPGTFLLGPYGFLHPETGEYKPDYFTFDTDTLQLCAAAEGDTVDLWTQDAHGQVGMTARATLG